MSLLKFVATYTKVQLTYACVLDPSCVFDLFFSRSIDDALSRMDRRNKRDLMVIFGKRVLDVCRMPTSSSVDVSLRKRNSFLIFTF